MTDNVIIKALECCGDTGDGCLHCPLLGTSAPECGMRLCRESLDLIKRQQAEIEDLNHSIDTLGRVKEQLKENLSETEAKYQKEITRLDDVVVCKNKVIRGLEKSFENAYDGAIKEFAELVDKDIEEKLSDSIKEQNPDLYLIHKIVKDRLKEMVGEE